MKKNDKNSKLSSEQHYVLRDEGTEHPGSSSLNNEKRKGVFDSGDDYLEWRGELTAPFILKAGSIPSAKIAFGTATALGFYNPDTDNNDCDTRADEVAAHGFYAAEPDVTITLY